MEKVGETVFLGVLNGDHVTILDMVESRNEMKLPPLLEQAPPPCRAHRTGSSFPDRKRESRRDGTEEGFGPLYSENGGRS